MGGSCSGAFTEADFKKGQEYAQMGRCSFYGYGGYKEDKEMANLYYKLAAKHGSVDGKFYCIYYGVDQKPDIPRAITYATASVNPYTPDCCAAVADALYATNSAHYNNTSSPIDGKILLLRGMAAEAGHPVVAVHLSDLYSYQAISTASAESRLNELYWVQSELAITAFQYVKRLAEQNYPPAVTRMGNYYALGIGTDTNPKEAFKWARRSAEMGIKEGMRKLAECYARGFGISYNFLKMVEWRTKADGHFDQDQLDFYTNMKGECSAAFLRVRRGTFFL